MSAVAVDTVVEEIEPWELHSELVLVSPEVCRRALELLPERDPDAFLARPPTPIAPARAAVALRYALWRLGHTARFALAVTVGSVGLALLAEVVR
ncbi:MAG: hypothetical protein ACRDNH_10025 [Gaiellaceae bacterium]